MQVVTPSPGTGIRRYISFLEPPLEMVHNIAPVLANTRSDKALTSVNDVMCGGGGSIAVHIEAVCRNDSCEAYASLDSGVSPFTSATDSDDGEALLRLESRILPLSRSSLLIW